MELIMASIEHTQKHCSGGVELALYKVRTYVRYWWWWYGDARSFVCV
jgi:hypothetical protein